MVDWLAVVGLLATGGVEAGTLALAAMTYRKSKIILADRRAQQARDLLADVYGPLQPFQLARDQLAALAISDKSLLKFYM